MENRPKATQEQLAYAKVLDLGMKLGLLAIIITFAVYMSGMISPHIPVKDVSKYWNMKAGDYLFALSKIEEGKGDEATGIIKMCKEAAKRGEKPEECKAIAEAGHKYSGWSWTGRLGKSDFLNFLGVAFLAGVTIVCFIPVIPIFLKKKDKVYALMSLLEMVVLVLAASGILKVGGH